MENKELTIAICTYNRSSFLTKTIQALFTLDNIEKAEIIIVDNNSTDNTAKEVRRLIGELNYEVKYINEKRQGLSYARNTAIKASECEYIAFLDDDAIPNVKWLNIIIQTFKSNLDIYAIGGEIIPDFEINKPEWLVKGLEHSYTIINLGTEKRRYPSGLYPFGANMAFRKDALMKYEFPNHLGRKGTILISGEETWIFNKFKEEGWDYYYIPGMVVNHFIPRERLQKEWVLKRFYYQGVTNTLMCTRKSDTLKLIFKICSKYIYINIKKNVFKK